MALEAGFGRALMNPPLNIPTGMWMAQKHVRGSGLDMDIAATVIVLRDGDVSTALIDLDLCFLSDSQAAAMRQAVREATGIPIENVLPFCSHTHAGPVIVESYRGEGEDCVAAYAQMLPYWVAGAAVAALTRLEPVRVAAGTGRSDIGVNRDLPQPDGRIVVGCNPEGFRDPEVGVIRFDSMEGRTLGSIVNYACHPTVLGPGNELISPDYPGSVRKTAEQATGGLCFFLQGAAGNVGPIETFVDDAAVARRLGTLLGLEAARVFFELQTKPVEKRLKDVVASGAALAYYDDVPVDVPEPRLRLASAYVDLPVRPRLAEVYEAAPAQLKQWEARLADLEAGDGDDSDIAVAVQQITRSKLRADRQRRYSGKKSLPVETQAIRLGDTAIVAIGGEPYSEIGVAVKSTSPFKNKTLVAGYLGGDMMYIPTREAYQFDPPSMEVDNSPYTEDAAELAADHLTRLLQRLGQDG